MFNHNGTLVGSYRSVSVRGANSRDVKTVIVYLCAQLQDHNIPYYICSYPEILVLLQEGQMNQLE